MKNIEINAFNLAYEWNSSKIILRNVQFSYQEGDIICLLGNNGAGKSTLLKICAGILKPTLGSVAVIQNGKILAENDKIIKTLAWLPQQLNRPEHFSVKEFLTLQDVHSIRKHLLVQESFIFKVLNAFEIAHLYEAELKQLSGGEWKRVQLARIWLQEANIVFMDEPDSDLDLKYKYLLIEYCKNYVKENKAILFLITHDLNFAKNIATKICALKEGLWVWDSNAMNFLDSKIINKLYDL